MPISFELEAKQHGSEHISIIPVAEHAKRQDERAKNPIPDIEKPENEQELYMDKVKMKIALQTD